MNSGAVCLVLHAHLPFVRHPEHEYFLEENWLYECIFETYLPLLERFDRLADESIPFQVTLNLSPPLCSMLADGLLQERASRRLNLLVELAGKERVRTRSEPALERVARFYEDRLRRLQRLYDDVCRRDLLGAFRRHADGGRVEIITCGATHGFLPLLLDQPEAVRAQIEVARAHHRAWFGRDPRGIWLPECAYVPGIEEFLRDNELRFFVVDSHGLLNGTPAPRYGLFAPVFTPAGPAAFGRDVETSKQVWSADYGYPGDPVYRDFYRDIGFDLPLELIGPYIHPDGIRVATGLKYHAITGRTVHKEPYDPDLARTRAREHAAHFKFNRERQMEHLAGVMGRSPVVVAPYDAELFGHWWFEGPDWIEDLIRVSAQPGVRYELLSLAEVLQRFPTQQISTPAASSWGDKGYWEVWLNGANDWIYPRLHHAAERMIHLARRYAAPSDLERRALNQAARELLLAQSSDWAFIMTTATAVDYAANRTRLHLARFQHLADGLDTGRIPADELARAESADNIFPYMDYRVYG